MRISDWSSDVCSSDLNIGWSVAGARGFAIEAYGTNGRLRIEAPSGFPDAGNAALFHAPAGPREALGKPEEPVELPATLAHLRGAPVAAPADARAVTPMTLMPDDVVSAVREWRECSPGFAHALTVQAVF